jgi:putative hydrolase of the HAD superfamily
LPASASALPLPACLDAVLFDAGGVLLHLDYRFIARAAQRRGARVDALALYRAEGASRRAVDRSAAGGELERDAVRLRGYLGQLLAAAGLAEPTTAAVLDDLEREHRARNLWRVPPAEAAETLAELRARGLRTAVVSNADGRVERGLEEAGLARHLDLVVDSQLEGVEKPDPEIFRRALARLGVAAERAAYVGDIYSVDALGARAAGLAPVILDGAGAYTEIDCPTIEGLGRLLECIPPRA